MSWYAIGTVAVTNNNAAVVGTGTNWVANVQAGDIFWGPDGRGYEVVSVNSNTSLTIGPVYAGATAGGQAYRITPTQGRVIVLTEGVNTLLTQFGGIRDGIGSGNFPDGTAAAPALRFGADADTGLYRPANDSLGIATGGAERVRLTSIGLGVGTTNPTSKGHFSGTNATIITVESTNAGAGDTQLRILTPDRDWRIGQNVGGVGVGALVFYDVSAGSPRLVFDASGIMRPGSDNTQPLGAATFRWSTAYLGSSPVVTSDEREKTWRSAPTVAELAAARRIIGELGFYRWNDAITEKGDGARYHFGPRAQRVWAIMADEGLIDPIIDGRSPSSSYAFLCYDAWDAVAPVEAVEEVRGENGEVLVASWAAVPGRPAGNRFGVCPDQLALFLIAAQEARIAALEAAT
ncbi:tail fiber domain-containing protein [Sphingopyxis sp. LARHCG72]